MKTSIALFLSLLALVCHAQTQFGIPITAPGCTSPSISGQPAAITCITNTTTNFTVTASGTAALAYQWRDSGAGTNLANGTAFSGVTTATLWASNVTTAFPTNYVVVITNACGSITSSVATLTVTNGASGGNELSTALVAWWEHEEATSADRTDSTGNGHTLVHHGAVIQDNTHTNGTWASGVGNDKYLDCADSVFKSTADFTLAGWVNGLGNDAGFIASRYSSGQIAWYIYGVGNHATFNVRKSDNSGDYQMVSTVNITAAGYHHIAVGISGTTAFLQVDDETRVTTSTDGLRSTTAALTFADLDGGSGSAVPCKLDAWGWWNVGLSTGSVTALQTTFYPFP